MLANRIDLRSYHAESCSHAHDFAQLVLPVSGALELEAGRYSVIVDHDIGVYIAPNEQHRFAGSQNNLFLVIGMATPMLNLKPQVIIISSNLFFNLKKAM